MSGRKMNIMKKSKFVKQSTVNSENMTGGERNYSENRACVLMLESLGKCEPACVQYVRLKRA